MDKSIEYIETNDSSDDSCGVASKLTKFLSKRNLKLLFFVGVGIVVLVLCCGFGKNKTTKVNDIVVTNSNYISTMDYCKILEDKLIEVLSSVDGVGQVKVMVTVDGSPELVYASEKDETSSSNTAGSTTSSIYSSPIIIDADGSSSALVMTEKLPNVKGVIVVSSGAGNVATKLNLLNAVATLLDISTDQVTILKGV